MMTVSLLGHNVRVVQTGGWRYAGRVVEEKDELFLTIIDDKTQRRVQLRRDSLLVLEVVA